MNIELPLLVFVVATALATTVLRDVLASIIAFATYSLGVAVVWVVLQAPGVGLTEAAVGAGVTTVLFLLTIAKTVRPGDEAVFERLNVPAFGAAVVLVGALLTTVHALPTIGDPSNIAVTSEVTRYYIDHAYHEAGVKNVVTAVLASYRGFDTLGEAVVVYSAGVGLLVVLRREVFA